MKYLQVLIVVLFIPVIFGCQKLGQDTLATAPEDAQLVADVEGNLFDINCLRMNAKAITTEGRKRASSCWLGNAKDTDTTTEGRGYYYGNNYNNYLSYYWYYWYIYPPSYYNTSYNTNYNNSSNNSQFCNYIFGNQYGYNYNCYKDFFQFDSYDNSYYDSECSYCLYMPNKNRCYDRCWFRQGWYW